MGRQGCIISKQDFLDGDSLYHSLCPESGQVEQAPVRTPVYVHTIVIAMDLEEDPKHGRGEHPTLFDCTADREWLQLTLLHMVAHRALHVMEGLDNGKES